MKKAALFVLTILLLAASILTGCSKKTGEEKNLEKTVEIDWRVRNEYSVNDQLLFRMFPNPKLTAREPYGYLIHFTDPFEIFAEKKLAIYAYHKETDERITALSPTTITEPSPGYSGLERFTFTCSLPRSGLWRYEIVLDEQVYGDVILLVN